METRILIAAKIANAIAYFVFKLALILFSVVLLIGGILALNVVLDLSIKFEEAQSQELLNIVPNNNIEKPLENTM